MSEEMLRQAVASFSVLPDPRADRGQNHPLINIVAIALCAVVSDADSFYDIEDFGHLKRDWLSGFLDLSHGIPAHDTFGRVFSRLDPMHFQACALDWVRTIVSGKLTPGDVIALDGKTLCSSVREDVRAVHMVSAWSHRHGLCLTSTAVDHKSNEITALPSVLDTLSLLKLAGCIVTIDAMGTQREIAQKLVELEAHYVLALKDNQPNLYEDVCELFDQQTAYDAFETGERGHGRSETRQCDVISDAALLTVHLQDHDWPGLRSVIKLTSTRTIGDQTSTAERYFVSTLTTSAEHVLSVVRAHWEIENKLHWTLDVIFDEDRHSYAKDHGPENMAVLRHLALNLLRLEPSKTPLKRKRKKAALSDEYRASLLKLLV